jgi:hypothetical protein
MIPRSGKANPNGPGWSQSGNLTAGNSAQSVNLQCNFDDKGTDAVYTIQFKIGAATSTNQNPTVIQPSPTPANPPIGVAKVSQNNANFTLQEPVTLPGGTNLIFDTQPTKIYTLSGGGMNNTTNGTLTSLYTGITTNIANVSQATVNPIPSPPSVPGPTQPVDPVAIIQFTVQGNKVQRIISVSNGASISGPAEAIQVQVIDNTTYPNSVGFQYEVSIQVTPGVRSAIQPPILYWSYPPLAGNIHNELVVIPPAGEIFVAVPTNAGVASVSVSAIGVTAGGTPPFTTPNIAIIQLASSILVSANELGEPGTFIPVISNCSQLQIINNDQTNSVNVSLIWGIDG